MKAFSVIGITLVILVVCLGIPWLVMGNDFFLAKFFAPKMEDVRRETFEHSNAYNRGMVQELEKMYLDYSSADENHKSAIASVVLHRYADYPDKNLPAHLQVFVSDLRRPQRLQEK